MISKEIIILQKVLCCAEVILKIYFWKCFTIKKFCTEKRLKCLSYKNLFYLHENIWKQQSTFLFFFFNY
jgi:hypothetical protein